MVQKPKPEALLVETKRKKALAAAIGTFELMLPTIERDTTAAQYRHVCDQLTAAKRLLAAGDINGAEAHFVKSRHAALGRLG
jgi:hypothetical protein